MSQTPTTEPAHPVARRALRILRRRGWVVLATTVIGALAALGLASRTPPLYQAESVVVVPAANTGGTGLGQPDAANKLASTYAQLIPLDDAVIAASATKAGVSPTELRKGLTVSNDQGTSLIRIDVVSGSDAQAAATAGAVAVTLTRPTPPGQIAPGSLRLVQLPDSSTRVGESRSSSILLGSVLGLLVGLLAAAAFERSDRRLDRSRDLAAVLGTPATDWRHVTEAEAQAIAHRWRALSDAPDPTVAVMATGSITREEVEQLLAGLTAPLPLASRLDDALNSHGRNGSPAATGDSIATVDHASVDGGVRLVALGAPGHADGVELTAQTSDLVVLVARDGAPASQVTDAVAALRDFGITPAWGILAPHGHRHAPVHVTEKADKAKKAEKPPKTAAVAPTSGTSPASRPTSPPAQKQARPRKGEDADVPQVSIAERLGET